MTLIGGMTSLGAGIRNQIKEFEKGNGINREELGKNIKEFRKAKHEIRNALAGIKFGKLKNY